MESKLNDQQRRAIEKFGGEAQMYQSASELSELAGRIMQAAHDINATGKIAPATLWELKKERHDVGFMLPQFDAYMRIVDEGFDADMKAIAEAEMVRIEEKLSE